MIQINGQLTKTESKMVDLLSDGDLHLREELLDCMDDELSNIKAMRAHIDRIRKKLPVGLLIVHQQHPQTNRYCYRLVRRLASPYKE